MDSGESKTGDQCTTKSGFEVKSDGKKRNPNQDRGRGGCPLGGLWLAGKCGGLVGG